MDTALYEDVLAVIEDKIDEVALFFQDRLGITAGDQPPELAISMYETEEKLAKIITETLQFEKGDY